MFSKVIRYLLAFFLITMGINKFVGFLPEMNLASEASQFMTALAETGYMLNMVALVELGCGILLLSSAYTPIALLLLAPLSVNVVLFHIFLDPSTILFALLVFSANLFLGIKFFNYYRPIFVKLLKEKVIIKEKSDDYVTTVAEVG